MSTPQADSGHGNEQGILNAVDLSMAIIRFTPDGHILVANANFLNAVGYRLADIKGRHHRVFCEPTYAQSDDYRQFWSDLACGVVKSGTFKRVRSDGEAIYIEASYTPVKDAKGNVIEVIKFAQDVTEKTIQGHKSESKLNAVERAMARIEFTPEGEILDANANFYATMGYSPQEIKGRHHSMFCPLEIANSAEYHDFWDGLRAGQRYSGVFRRVRKNGEPVWLESSYTPMVNEAGEVIGVVKFAFDVTEKHLQARKNGQVVKRTQEISAAASLKNSSASEFSSANSVAIEQLATSVESGLSRVSELGRVASEVGSITKAIFEIAEETNLLALNAAIEAARAGKEGRGFAVVADEVRTLAIRTGRQAQSISDMVMQTQDYVAKVTDNMHTCADESRQAMDSTGKAIGELRELSEITGRLNTLMASLK
jgi:methyl-accepting chemotaxis protein